MNRIKRADIKVGAEVAIVQKQDQRTGRLTRGIVSHILTRSATHPHGIKVRLESGIVGRVKEAGTISDGSPSLTSVKTIGSEAETG